MQDRPDDDGPLGKEPDPLLEKRIAHPGAEELIEDMDSMDAFRSGWMTALFAARDEFNGLGVMDYAKLMLMLGEKSV